MHRLALIVLLASAPAFASTTLINRRIAPGQTLGSVLYASPLPPEQVEAGERPASARAWPFRTGASRG